MVHAHLRHRALTAPPIAAADHLDDDFLSAFVEGRLSEAESSSTLKHLVACSSCLHMTAQLVRLDSEVSGIRESRVITEEEPGRIRRLLDDLSSRVFVPTDDEAVFAYHAPVEDLEKGEATKAEDESSKTPTSDESADSNN